MHHAAEQSARGIQIEGRAGRNAAGQIQVAHTPVQTTGVWMHECRTNPIVPAGMLVSGFLTIVLLVGLPCARGQSKTSSTLSRQQSVSAEAMSVEPTKPNAALQEGITLFKAGKVEKAAQHFKDVIDDKKGPSHSEFTLYYAGLAYARLEKWDQARDYFRRLIEEHPKLPFGDLAAYELAWCERALQRNEQAMAHYELLLGRYPKSELAPAVQAELADMKLQAGELDAAISRFTEAVDSASHPTLKLQLRYQLASVFFKKKYYKNGAEQFESLMADAQRSRLLPYILFYSGESRLRLNESTKARDHFWAASQLKHVPAALAESILIRLSELQIRTDQLKEGEASYRNFLERYRDSRLVRNAHFGLALAMERQGKFELAIAQYRQLLARDEEKKQSPDTWTMRARFHIGECYFGMKDYDDAIAELVKLDADAKDYPSLQAKAVLEIGRILLAQKRKAESRTRMKEVIERFPKAEEAIMARRYLKKLQSDED